MSVEHIPDDESLSLESYELVRDDCPDDVCVMYMHKLRNVCLWDACSTLT